MRRFAAPLLLVALAALSFAVASHGQAPPAISCPSTDLPSTGAPKVVAQGTMITIWCGYSDKLYGYELSVSYYDKSTPAAEIASLRKVQPHYCTGYQDKPYRAFSSSVIAHGSVGGNPKSWDVAFSYLPALLAQVSGAAYSCSTPADGGGASGGSRHGCPGTKQVTKASEKVTYGWRFSFSGAPQNVTLTRNATSAGSGSGKASTFHCFYADGTIAEPRAGSGGGAVKFFPKNPPATATFTLQITGSPSEYVKGKTTTLRLSGRITRVQGSSCKPGPTTVVLVDGAQDSVSVGVCGATLRYANGRGARVDVAVG